MKGSARCGFAMGLLTLPAVALAHAGNDHWQHHGFGAGMIHPFTGVDHILVMVAIGMWAVQLGGPARWRIPLTFLVLTALGAITAGLKIDGTVVEGAILCSVFIAGLLLLLSLSVRTLTAAILVGCIALVHGHAHFAEMPPGDWPFAYLAGFLASTAILLTAGALVGGLPISYRKRAVRACGGAIVAA